MVEATEVLGYAVLISVVIAAFMARMAFESWQFQRNRDQVVDIVARSRAVDPYSARKLEEMGLKMAPFFLFRFGFRNFRNETVRALVQTGFLQKTDDGRYYLSPEACEFYVRNRNK